jgi:hypothetical protein
MRTGFLALMLLLPSFAAAETGSDLQRDCSVALKVFNNEQVTGEESIKVGHCIGFVTGVMQTASLRNAGASNSQSKDALAQACAPLDIPVEQVVRMALKRLESNPQELQNDAAMILLHTMNEGFPTAPCIASSGKLTEGLRWPDPPRKVPMKVRVVAVALALPRSSFFSSLEVLVAETEISDDEWSLIKLVFTYLPYQPRLTESGFDYSVVHEISAWRNRDCDQTVAELTARSMPERHEPLIYSRNVPREDLDRRRIPLPCYEAKADDYIKSTLAPIPQPPKPPPRPTLQVRPAQDPK